MSKAWSPTLLPNLLGTISAPSPRTYVPSEPRSSSAVNRGHVPATYAANASYDTARRGEDGGVDGLVDEANGARVSAWLSAEGGGAVRRPLRSATSKLALSLPPNTKLPAFHC